MKCQLKPSPHCENAVRIEFDRVIPPLFPRPTPIPGRMQANDSGKILFWSSPGLRDRHAVRVARGNVGKFHFELVNPVETYRQLFEQLAGVEGLIELVDLDRYSLGMEAGGMFRVVDVARRIATLLQQSFYPDDELEWGRGFVIPVLQTEDAIGDSPAELDLADSVDSQAGSATKCTASTKEADDQTGPKSRPMHHD